MPGGSLNGGGAFIGNAWPKCRLVCELSVACPLGVLPVASIWGTLPLFLAVHNFGGAQGGWKAGTSGASGTPVGNIGPALGGTGVASTVSGLAAVAASVTGLGV